MEVVTCFPHSLELFLRLLFVTPLFKLLQYLLSTTVIYLSMTCHTVSFFFFLFFLFLYIP
jgi:hypothetical protein